MEFDPVEHARVGAVWAQRLFWLFALPVTAGFFLTDWNAPATLIDVVRIMMIASTLVFAAVHRQAAIRSYIDEGYRALKTTGDLERSDHEIR